MAMQGLENWGLTVIPGPSVIKGIGIKQHPYQAGSSPHGDEALAGVAAAEYRQHTDEGVAPWGI